jgi:hypothetical protein
MPSTATTHWRPQREEPVQTAVLAAPVPSGIEKSGRPHSTPCEMLDQMTIAQLHSKKWPKAHNLQEVWAAIPKRAASSSPAPFEPPAEALARVSLDDDDLEI